jgi:hypothetical protein
VTLAEGSLPEPERELRREARAGKLVDLEIRDPDLIDPAQGENWSAARTVRAELLVELLTKGHQLGGTPGARAVKLRGARVIGSLDLEAATLVCPLLLWDCWLEQPAILREARAASLRLRGCHLPSLAADRLETRGNLELSREFTASSGVRLDGADIGGQLDCSGATLHNPNDRALSGDQLKTEGGISFRDEFVAQGEVRLAGSRVHGQLDCSGATLHNPNGEALMADGLTVATDLHCADGFTAEGEVRLPGAHIGGQLDPAGARLCNPNGVALMADRLKVEASMFCSEGFIAEGEVRLPSVQIEGQLGLAGATITEVDLTNAQVGVLSDDPGTWRALRLHGFVYDSFLKDDQKRVRERLRSLARDRSRYEPQPYEQLAAVYRRTGRDKWARQVAIAKQKDHRRALGRLGKLWNWLLFLTVGYGYWTWLAGLWLLALLLVGGTWAFHRADMDPAKYPLPPFNRWMYTLDLLLPIVNLGQRDAWLPKGVALWWSWLLIGAGWMLTTAVVAGLTNLFRRD